MEERNAITAMVTKDQVCPHCGTNLNTHCVRGESSLEEGDFTICGECMKISRFGDGLVLYKPSVDEMRLIEGEAINAAMAVGDDVLKRH